MSKFDPNAIWWSNDPLVSSIREEINKKHPSEKKILSHLFSLQIDDFDSDFIDLAGRTLHLNPKFFMESLYTPFRDRLGTIYGYEKRKEIEKSILEKFCLEKGEQILFECEGTIIKKVPDGYKLEVRSGIIFLTKKRIIAEGILKTSSYKGGESTWKRFKFRKPSALDFAPPIVQFAVVMSKKSPTPINAKKSVLFYSIQEESPCYGYVFPISCPHNLGTKRSSILYNDDGSIMEISSASFNVKENVDLFMSIFEEILNGLISQQKLQDDCPKCSLSRKIKLSRCSWCGKILQQE